MKHIALASYPRSGNTFVRHLLHKCCGFKTNTVYRENHKKRRDELLAELIDRDCPVTKTHEEEHWKKFGDSVVIVRNPLDAIGSYLDYAQNHENRTVTNIPMWWCIEARNWMRFYKGWSNRIGVVVRYEDLLEDPLKEVGRVARFLNIEVTNQSAAEEECSFKALNKRGSKTFYRRGESGHGITECPKETYRAVAGILNSEELPKELSYKIKEIDGWTNK